MKIAIIHIWALLILLGTASSQVRLPSIISDNMLLQRNSSVNLWGWAGPGEKLAVKAGWQRRSVSATADSTGRWSVRLKTGGAGGPYSITVSGTNELVVRNVLLGEVWVCSGQSNMEFTIRMLGGWGMYAKEKRELESNDFSAIRLCQVQKAVSATPAETCTATWSPANAKSLEDFSATAYFFGRALYRTLHVPIGLISSNWGGTPAEAWTPTEAIEHDPGLSFYRTGPNADGAEQCRPSVLFNGMIHPLLPYCIRGVIWYQGESNRNDADLYLNLFATMIKRWRQAWNLGEFPFYYVQIAPYRYDEPFPSSAYLREAQLRTLSSAANTGMAVTMDIGDVNDIHPKNKQEVGRRLALWALAKTYRVRVGPFSGPVYKSMRREGTSIRLFFDHAGSSLRSKGERLTGFTIAGPDGNFAGADARIDGKTVLVSSDKVPDPVAVRFAFTNTDSSLLFNREGLPVSSFRTDTTPFFVRKVIITLRYDRAASGAVATMACPDTSVRIRYTTDGSRPSLESPVYEKAVSLTQSAIITATAFRGDVPSALSAEAAFRTHLGLGKTVRLARPPSDRYTGGGEGALTDGVTGTLDFRDGHWQGYEGIDFDGVLDLGDTVTFSTVSLDFLQNMNSWIFLPRSVEFSYSSNDTAFSQPVSIPCDEPAQRADAFTKAFTVSCPGTRARFVKFHAQSIRVCPPWHPGAGGKAWLFVDELIVQ